MREDVFSRITAATKKLNTLADEVSARFRDAESKLEHAGVGFYYRGQMLDQGSFTDPESGASQPQRRYLVYQRIGVNFRICVQEEILGGATGPSGEVLAHMTKPVLDCDRQTRIVAGKVLDSFLEGIAMAIEEIAARLERDRLIVGAARKLKAEIEQREVLAAVTRTMSEAAEASSPMQLVTAIHQQLRAAQDAAAGQRIPEAIKAAGVSPLTQLKPPTK